MLGWQQLEQVVQLIASVLKLPAHLKTLMQVCEDYDKPRKLQRIMEKIVDKEGSKIIIFTETKKNADMLTRNMRQDGYRAGPVYVHPQIYA